MGDLKRFDLFSKLISDYIPKDNRIADISGGKGYLQLAMRQIGFNNITTYDKQYKKKNPKLIYRYQFFNYKTTDTFETIVAMHPDEGTDHALMYALIHYIPAILCPCCVKPSALLFNESYKFNNWCNHLTRIADKYNRKTEWITLKMNGRNKVLIML